MPEVLVIFDIDGTLTESMHIDSDCFVRSLDEVCGFRDIETDWALYQNTTDSGIFYEIHKSRTGRPPLAEEISKFRRHFINLLQQASSATPFAPVAGAPQLLTTLSRSAEHRIALGTGGWRDSARLKMASAGLCYDDYPAASSDDAFDRASIIKISSQRAAARHGEFNSTVYIGDGVWDARACRALEIPFIGIGAGAHATRLKKQGAVRVFPNLSDEAAFLNCLRTITNASNFL